MPSRNVDKQDISESYYHVFARGASKQKIFIDAQDYRYFIGLLTRYLSNLPTKSKTGVIYPHYKDCVELNAFCLMKNHFHMLIFQVEKGGMSRLMKSIMTSYSRYFNLKYERSGPLFESRYKAVRISNDIYLEHISRYIHLNPRSWQSYRYSSLKYYMGEEPPPEWLKPKSVMALFTGVNDYLEFLSDYEDVKLMYEEIKHELADR